ncbi:hypothetical protein BDZ94DRAFT_1224039 [Collybia nuda]|uniref:TauD/TfdA-like domain-containing protein n=1 Tax=Collybia nuda TaxID=64659 RepID=A0A9P5XYA5_9AGAR|nr:hypothetical protein BDZ94DRAFT_1224039 [Collybia nuda]
MAIELVPLSLPLSADPSRFIEFGREVRGVNPATLNPEEVTEIRDALYKHDVLLFRGVSLTPEQQHIFTKELDPTSEGYGHINKPGKVSGAIQIFGLKTIPRVPAVQLLGNGTVHDHEGFEEVELKHPSHKKFHKTPVSATDEESGITRFCRWHMDAAFYDVSPSRVTSLYGLVVPKGAPQTVKYDDGTGDELPVPLATTAFVSGHTMFDILPAALKSLAVRSRVKYAPHMYLWMSPAHILPTGLGIETEDLEMPLDQLPEWHEAKCKTLPVLWKNEGTGKLHFQVHPCGVMELFIDPLPMGVNCEGALYPEGAHITNLKEVRDLLYRMQRPAISPEFVYPHEWRENDLIIFHNRGLMHSVVGALTRDQVRVFHQCTLAGSDDPIGPSTEDVNNWA